jgi:hypothetical protein
MIDYPCSSFSFFLRLRLLKVTMMNPEVSAIRTARYPENTSMKKMRGTFGMQSASAGWKLFEYFQSHPISIFINTK